jgi:hypothetical protein
VSETNLEKEEITETTKDIVTQMTVDTRTERVVEIKVLNLRAIQINLRAIQKTK